MRIRNRFFPDSGSRISDHGGSDQSKNPDFYPTFQHLPCPARELTTDATQRTTPSTGAIFFRTRKRVREGGGGGGTVGGAEGWDDG